MKKILKSMVLASLGLAILFSCTKNEPVVGTADGNGQMKLSVTGVLGEYKAVGDTKASLVNTPRVGWSGGETVHVFQQSDGTYLGSLTSSVKATGASVATLGGTISSGTGTLVFVYTNATMPSLTAGTAYTSLEISLAEQGADIPFVVYGTAESPGTTTVSGLVVNFSFATSVVSTYAAGLPAEKSVMKATLGDINTNCVLTIPTSGDITVSGSTSGIITKSAGIGSTNAEGQVLFEIAVPVSEAAASGRSVEFTIDSEPYTAAFSNVAIEAGKAYSAMSENHSVEGVALNKTSTTIFPTATETLTATVYPAKSNQGLTWKSSNTSVVTVDGNGIITGKGLGTATITATSQDDTSINATCTVTVDNHKYVVIGGLKWATCNIGADSPADYCWYFSWGNTDGYVHNGTNWVKASDNTKLGTDGSFSSANYNNTPGHSLSGDISPASVNDAARINWGGDWRMPTKENFVDLAANGVWIWTSDYNSTGKSGYIVYVAKDNADKGKAKMNEIWKQWNSSTKSYDSGSAITEGTYSESIDDHIFFPAAGSGYGTSLSFAGSYGFWSSAWDSADNAYYFYFYSGDVKPQSYGLRYVGFPVRPVSDL